MEFSDEDYSSTGDEEYEDAFVIIDEEEVRVGLLDDKSYTILKVEDIGRRQEEAITRVCGVLSVSKTTACVLLRRCNWSADEVLEKWFSDEKLLRKGLGFLEDDCPSVQFSSKDVACGICFEFGPIDKIHSAVCGHPFCESCWKSYIQVAVNDGPGCLMLRCPEPSCGDGGGAAAVGIDMIEKLASSHEKKRYHQFLLRSYVEDNRNCKWCPSAGCVLAVELCDSGFTNYEVTCSCSHSFCWNCSEEKHRPISCEMVANWAEKMVAESNNTRWILAFTKPCPKCKRPIEKNRGCNRMTCPSPCRFQFCWLCLCDWSVHGYGTCNRYNPSNDTEKAEARKYMERYTHYYERWASNHKSSCKAFDDLRRMKNVNLEKLCKIQCQSMILVDFVVEAWKQIVECRVILKWSYAYGYYLPENERKKKQLFEYLQGQAEVGLERLHHCSEQELQEYYLEKEGPSENFGEFRSKLKDLTHVTRHYFENLVRALENGLTEVDSSLDRSCAASSAKRPRSS